VQNKLSEDLFAEESQRVETELQSVDREVRLLDEPFEGTVQDLIDLEAVMKDLGQLYRHCEPHGRRQINQALYKKLLVGDDGVSY
jgi:hypothetical protein